MQHENIERSGEVIEIGSDRSFGFVFAVVFAIVGLWPLWGGGAVRPWAFGVAAAFGLLALVAPGVLHRANMAWGRLGILLGKVVAPVALGILFYLVFTPMGWAMRRFGANPLKLARSGKAETYWIERKDGQPTPESLRNQF